LDKTGGKAPSLRFIFSHPAHLLACGFGSGLSPFAPGTVGTLFAWATYPLLRSWMNDLELLGFLAACFIGGILAVHKTGADLGVADHGSIVWDEIVPFWLVLFRLFDIFKPQPARYFDQKVKNGFGVMADDLVAGAYTVLVLVPLRQFMA